MSTIKKRMKQKGFTLIEIIVVVVILAVLAALVLPNFLQQPENAAIAEAQEMLGALRRAQVTANDTGGAFIATATPATAAELARLGIVNNTTRYSYNCTAAGACTATRLAVGAGARTGATITLNANGTYVCGGTAPNNYTIRNAADTTRGCGL